MGLDVSLYKCPANLRGVEDQKEEEYNKHSEEIWEKHLDGRKYNELSEDEKKVIKAETEELALGLGLKKDGGSTVRERVEIVSKIHPEHQFKIGYLRSSYNGAGLNSVLRELEIPDLFEIFAVVNEGYFVEVDWDASLERITEALEKFQMFLNSPEAKYEVIELSFFTESQEKETRKDTLEKFMSIINDKTSFSNFSHKSGHYFLDGVNIKAVRLLPSGGRLGISTVHLVADSKEENYFWYKEALEVTQEMIEYVLNTGSPEDYFLGWSG